MMKIGITYDLKSDHLNQGMSLEDASEFDEEETIIAIQQALQKAGFAVERIGSIYNLVTVLASGVRFDLVFNIAEGRWGRGRESQVPALLDAYQIPYVFSDALTLSLALDKAATKCILQSHGIQTAPFCVIYNMNDCLSVCKKLSFPLFVKPLAEGSSMGIGEHSLIDSLEALRKTADYLLKRFKQPILVEPFLPGKEFTVGILGTGDSARVLGVMEINNTPMTSTQNSLYCYDRKMGGLQPTVELVQATDAQAQQAAATALVAWSALGCRDAGRVDLRSDTKSVPQVLEINPLSGLRPNWSSLAIIAKLASLSYDALIEQIVTVAIRRIERDAHENSSSA